MSISITNENKSNLSITNENKGVGQETWDESADTLEGSPDAWEGQGNLGITLEDKNSLSVTNEDKS